jgi:hypothetical protein
MASIESKKKPMAQWLGLVFRTGQSAKCIPPSADNMFNVAMENCPFIDGLPIKNGDFPWLC